MDADRMSRVAATLAERGGRPVLERLLVTSVDLLAMSGAGIAVIDKGQHCGAVALSAPRYAPVDELQFTLGEGPCIDADRSGNPVLEPDLLDALAQWPAFAPAAVALAVRATFAFPLRIGAVRVGVLTLYRDVAGQLADGDLRDAIVLGHVASHLMLELENDAEPGGLPDRLREVVSHRAHVHQATGMVAAQLNVDVAVALSRLRAYAWSRDLTIDSVAADVVARRLRLDEVG